MSGVLEHAGGALSTLTTTFDGVATTAAPIEVQGEEGTLAVPDPNTFDGEVRHLALDGPGWRTLQPRAGYVAASRGVGLIDLVHADELRPPRASGAVALHVLDIMTALLRSAEEGRRVELTTTVDAPHPSRSPRPRTGSPLPRPSTDGAGTLVGAPRRTRRPDGSVEGQSGGRTWATRVAIAW